jgi:hypothetical protein
MELVSPKILSGKCGPAKAERSGERRARNGERGEGSAISECGPRELSRVKCGMKPEEVKTLKGYKVKTGGERGGDN